MLRACALLGICSGLAAACSDDSSSDTSGGNAGSAGNSSQAGESSGGSNAHVGKGGAAQGGEGAATQGGKAGSGALGGAGLAAGGNAEAGAEAGGAGGQNIVGAAGEAGDAGAAGAGGNGGEACPVYDAKVVPVDQSQLGGTPDSWNVYESTGIGQFITSGKTGLLAAVELSFAVACNEKKGSVQLYVYDAPSSAKLGQASVPMSALACKNGGNLSTDNVGAAFFDFASQCIHVTATQKLRVEVHLVDTGTCVDLKCVGGSAAGNNCNGDAQCSGIIISASQPSTYAGGSIEFKGVAGSPDDNLNFKTFVAN